LHLSYPSMSKSLHPLSVGGGCGCGSGGGGSSLGSGSEELGLLVASLESSVSKLG